MTRAWAVYDKEGALTGLSFVGELSAWKDAGFVLLAFRNQAMEDGYTVREVEICPVGTGEDAARYHYLQRQTKAGEGAHVVCRTYGGGYTPSSPTMLDTAIDAQRKEPK